VAFPHYYYYYYGTSGRNSNQPCDGKAEVCYLDYCQLGVSSCFNSTGTPAAVNSILDGVGNTAMDAELAPNTTPGGTVNITAVALAASSGMPPLQLVPCPSSDHTECYTAARGGEVYVCNGRRAPDINMPVDAACGEVLPDIELPQLQALTGAQATSSASLPLVSVLDVEVLHMLTSMCIPPPIANQQD
jgi:hypothetical protein